MANPAAVPLTTTARERHRLAVRVTHWISALCFFALLVSGIELVISHPRFYWGEEGNSLTESLFDLPIPASRGYVKTGYDFVLPDQNGWSRSLHFQTAWFVIFTGLFYVWFSWRSGHLRRELLPAARDLSWGAVLGAIGRPGKGEAWSYNVVQRIAYLVVIYGLFPVMVWTGLAMAPGITAGFPFLVEMAGGHQSARTIHFFATLALVVFLVVHVLMVYFAGFWSRVRAMITGRVEEAL